ncbi:hypothetical protein HNQ75_004576 [Rhizobium flavum]|uniref:Uncharacterized protein n=1 Tax=Pseudorhizobium flavum TaxID=1335061 RepID=A0A7W9Z286_9HYPH|nr:hypothetical protein [Pseudorhizobium flavum]
MAVVLAFCVTSFSKGSATREFSYPIIDRIDTNIVRLEATSVPGYDFAVLCMSRLCHCVQELLEAGQSADIFRRRAPFAVDEARIFDCRIGVRDGLNSD